MTELEFNALAAAGYNRIPLVAEILADLDNALSLYLKLVQGQAQSFLLESVVGGERHGRYSFIGLPARVRIQAKDQHIQVLDNEQVIETHEGDPLAFIEQFQGRYKAAPCQGLPRFVGGLAGYFGYDMVRHIEPKLGPNHKPDPQSVPDMVLLLTEELAIVDNVAGRVYLIVYADPTQAEAYSQARSRLRTLRAKLRRPVDIPYCQATVVTDTRRDFDKADYLAAAQRAKDYIGAGDLMQVQVGQLICKPFRDSPLSLYRALRSLNPSPYMYYYNLGDFYIVGASPEILVRHETIQHDGQERTSVTIRPIAGTRSRGKNPSEDAALAEELLADPKEVAEHVMLIDLARNDLGRIVETGSVKVTETMQIERYSHVMHMVSNITGLLKKGLSAMDVLRASFPAGTLTGAPKVRAMEIIDELEPVKRGIYGGAVGYLSFNGDMDVAIAIRTGIIKEGMLYVQAAAGIVADSDPEKEWQETEAKARAVLRAAEQVQYGLDAPP